VTSNEATEDMNKRNGIRKLDKREKKLTSPEVTMTLERSREEMQQVVLSSWPLSRRGFSLSFGTAFSAMDAISASLNCRL